MVTREPHRGPASQAGFDAADEEKCRSFLDAVELVGKKWTAVMLLAGVQGARRFREYRNHVPGISDRMLAQRFRELEANRLIERTVVPTTPVLVTYVPTERGRGLLAALRPLMEWSLLDRDRCDHR
ncbi:MULTISPECIES: winged helix-turn-helix transcriptional regulator [Actinoalloteichus]|uniref:Transcriptional regulator, HxlR family n=1 Tax=Actinoalloteichus fjordicus TaxID=1612552 RepID=A0AAC9PQG0_9PSEU|nr:MULTISPECIES: helix-turn-helix domain-containing protein [Actinoalloteichus]APU12892.1 transcriptional regulator, HxlR family [Actinoalloteichus fjordicus]APU18864.1 transcriptional regulator, HxlR family [Actinoalloteichus sp. GBA129-24]